MAYLNVFINNSNKNPINVNRDTKPVPPGPDIDKWVKEHTVFWYDMSKPVDVYTQNFNDWRLHPSVNADIIITSTSFVITRFATLNDTVKCYIPDQTKNFPGMKVEVKGIVDGQELYWGYSADVKLIEITSDGTYDIPPLETVRGNLSFRNGNIAGACNITITQLPSGQSVPTNEILKANPYLQDFSGNNRPLKLNNFLFAAMSGVGGYSYFSEDIVKTSSNWYEVLYRGSNNGASLSFSITGITDLNSKNPRRGKIEILDTDASKIIQTIISDGEYNITIPSSTTNFSIRFGGGTQSEVVLCDVVISPIPLYPDSLVTDGVDDYGVVENLQQGVKVLFVTINPFIDGKFIYDKRLNTTEPWLFAVFNDKGSIAYNSRNSNGKTYIDGTLNESTIVSALLNKKQIITIVNNDVTGDKTKTPIFFSNTYHNSGWISSAFYNSFGFDSVPTKETDGFTEQELIDYVLENIITQ
jgi:hypothetical protein